MARAKKDDKQKRLRAKLDAINKTYSRAEQPAILRASELQESYGESPPAEPVPIAPPKYRKELDDLTVIKPWRRDEEDTPKVESFTASTAIPRASSENAATPVTYGRDLPRREKESATTVDLHKGKKVILEQALDGDIVQVDGHGKYYLYCTTVSDVEGAEMLDGNFASQLQDVLSPLCTELSRICDPGDLTVEDFVFMDIETTGLSATPVFLIGVMVWTDDGFEVQQFLARDYAEESAIVKVYNDLCSEKKILVTFNGKSFDVPFLKMRSAACRIEPAPELIHLDLLHVGRRIWKGQFENCKLQTLETHVCGRKRVGDIPGSEIPDAYHDYVRTKDARLIVESLKHNMLDLVTLADLMTHFPP